MTPSPALDEETLRRLVRRIAEAARPKRTPVLGPAARGEMGPHGDVDLLVVTPDAIQRRRTAQAIYRSL